MGKDKRITTIVLDKEADRKSKIIAEFTGKSVARVYRNALDAYFEHFINNELFSAINSYFAKLYYQYDIDNPKIYDAIQSGNFADAAVMIAEAIKQLPQEPEAQKLIDEGMRLISILSK
jgi:predicted transcriptional regulator